MKTTTKERIEKDANDFQERLGYDVELYSPANLYACGATVERNKAIDEFYNLMDEELQTEPINRTRYMIRLNEIRNKLKL